MKKRENLLDERQEMTLLRIERNGCWIAFIGLAALSMIQQIVFQFDIRVYAGEGILFLVMAFYLLISCAKNGIWDRHLKADTKTNALISVIASVITSAAVFLTKLRGYPDRPYVAVAAGAFSLVLTFILCFIALQFLASLTKKRQEKLEEETEE